VIFYKIFFLILILNLTCSFKNIPKKYSFLQTKMKLSNNILNNNGIYNKELSLIGISYKNNSIKDIEKIMINKNKLPKFHKNIITNGIADEIVTLSTCNRFEIYTYSNNSTYTINKIKNILLTKIKCNELSKINDSLYIYKNKKALEHLIKVSSGLDSLIFGEKQIREQIKKTILDIKNNRLSGLEKVFSCALESSDNIRQIENFNCGDTSIVSVSVDLLTNKINNSSKILIIGSGNTSKLLINYLRNRNITNIFLSNRNIEGTIKLKNHFNKLNITIKDYINIFSTIFNYDYVFFATSSPIPLLNYDDFVKLNATNTLTMIDLCVPMNVEPSCNNTKNAYLFNIDNLKKMQILNEQNNKNIMEESNEIIKRCIDKFIFNYTHLQKNGTI